MDLYKIRQQLVLGESLSNIQLRVTHYARVSTEHKEQESSLTNQMEHFEKLIRNNSNWTYVDGYVDKGISGTTDTKRSEFMKMINDARKNKFDLIITKEISRFSRNTLDSIKYTRELLLHGVAVYFVNDNINTLLPDSELRLTIMSSLAQDEIRKLSERVKFGMNASIQKGNILGNNQLYGYKRKPNEKNLSIVPEQAKVIKRLFILYTIHNKSLTEIAKIFNSENIKTNQNKKFTATTLSRIIKNIKYKGYYCGKKTEVVDYITKKIKYIPQEEWIVYKDTKKIPAIIEEDLWNRANKKLKGLSKKTKKSQRKYKYSSILFCKNHNAPFYRRKQCTQSNDITYLCSKYLSEGKHYCLSPNIRESELNLIFKNILYQINICHITEILLNLYHKKKNDELRKVIEEKISSEPIMANIISLLIEKIVISKEEDFIKFEIKTNYKINDNITDRYTFNRTGNKKNSSIKYVLEFY